MSRSRLYKSALPLAVTLLTFAPLAVGAQNAPPPPGAPGAPPPPAQPPASPPPTAPPGGGGSTGQFGGSQIMMPPPPPPPPPAPILLPPVMPTAPPGSLRPGGVPLGTPPLPNPLLMTNPAPPLSFGNNGTQKVRLRYKFTAGQIVRYHLAMDIDGSVQVGDHGTKQPMKQHMEMTLAQTVKSVQGNQATISEQISGLLVTMNGKAISLPLQAQQQIQQPFTLVQTTRGKIVSFHAPAGAGSMMVPGMNLTQLENMQTLLPADAVTPGTSTWRTDATSTTTGIETHAKYTLDSLSSDGKTATIGQKIWLQFKPPKTGAASMPVKINGLMTGTGTEQFDVAAGRIASQSNTLHMDLTVMRPGSAVPIKTSFEITANMQPQTGTVPATPAAPAPGDEPPTNQLQ